MNIVAFGLPDASYQNPLADGASSGLGFYGYALVFVYAEGSMRAIFCILFGASICMLAPKLSNVQYFSRYFVLLLIGAINAYILLWPGDVLLHYALCAFLLYFVRNLSARSLLTSGLALLLLMSLVLLPNTLQAIHVDKQGPILPNQALSEKTERKILAETKRAGLPYLSQLKPNAAQAIKKQTVDFLTGYMWDSLVMMLFGMALYKMKWLKGDTAKRWRSLYGGLLLLLVASLFNGVELYFAKLNHYPAHWVSAYASPSYQLGRLLMALAYCMLFRAMMEFGVLARARLRLENVGRMALSNYLFASVIGVVLFSGAGLGLFNQLSREVLYGIVMITWVFQIIASNVWLNFKAQGPVEALWRKASKKLSASITA